MLSMLTGYGHTYNQWFVTYMVNTNLTWMNLTKDESDHLNLKNKCYCRVVTEGFSTHKHTHHKGGVHILCFSVSHTLSL